MWRMKTTQISDTKIRRDIRVHGPVDRRDRSVSYASDIKTSQSM